MIEVEGLSRRHGGLVVVWDVSFDAGLLEPSAGRIAIGGRDMARERRAIQRDIGYLPENCPVCPDMTGA